MFDTLIETPLGMFLQFFLSGGLIVFAGSFLAKSADQIAELTGWGRLFVGSLLLAGATSLPELMVDIHSIQLGLPDLAVGDLLGSCLFNLFILALLDFGYPSTFRRTSFSPRFLHHSLSAVLTMALVSVLGVGLVSKSPLSLFGVSIFAWAVLALYLYGVRLIFRDGQNPPLESPLEMQHDPKRNRQTESKILPIIRAFSVYIGCSLLILFSAPYLVQAADRMATASNLGHTFVGTTLVALTTSLPEMIATLTAFRMGSPDLALGNIFGSNAFNLILFVPLDWLYAGDLFSAVRPIHSVTAFSVIAATGIAVMGQLYRKKERSRLTEPSSEAVVVVILGFLLLLYFLKH